MTPMSNLAREGPLCGGQQRVGLFVLQGICSCPEDSVGDPDLRTKEQGCEMDIGEPIQQALLSTVG